MKKLQKMSEEKFQIVEELPIKNLAYHEVGHFIFNRLFQNVDFEIENLEFDLGKPTAIQVTNSGSKNFVRYAGFGSLFEQGDDQNEARISAIYTKNPKAALGQIFIALAGYSAAQFFCGGEFSNGDEHDLAFLNNLNAIALNELDIEGKVLESQQVYNVLHLQMKKPAIREAFQVTVEQILAEHDKHNGVCQLEGQQIEKLIGQVDEILRDVASEEILEEMSEKLKISLTGAQDNKNLLSDDFEPIV